MYLGLGRYESISFTGNPQRPRPFWYPETTSLTGRLEAQLRCMYVELETTTAPGQPTPTDETSRLGCMCYTTTSAWYNGPEMMKATAARIAVSLAAHVHLARSPDE